MREFAPYSVSSESSGSELWPDSIRCVVSVADGREDGFGRQPQLAINPKATPRNPRVKGRGRGKLA
jgi:hypothetical protein